VYDKKKNRTNDIITLLRNGRICIYKSDVIKFVIRYLSGDKCTQYSHNRPHSYNISVVLPNTTVIVVNRGVSIFFIKDKKRPVVWGWVDLLLFSNDACGERIDSESEDKSYRPVKRF